MVTSIKHMVSVFQKDLLPSGPGNSRPLGMGRHLLRRKNLTVTLFKQNFILFISILFISSYINLYADDNRPMRTAPSAAVSIQTNPSTFIPAENSLLTEKALSQPLTQRYIAQYTSPHGIATLKEALERGKYYIPFIMEEVARRGLPPELAWLPIIESGFIITARSRSGAVGLWQFMLNSISGYNMRVNDTLDERRDFIRSTMGALQKLTNEHRSLNDWELTLAAYNSGFNAVTRAMNTSGISDYWELCGRNLLGTETIHFVPKLIAAAYVVSQPRRFGLDVWDEKFEWDTIALSRQVSVDIVADEAGIERNVMRLLNAELLYGISPAGLSYQLKVPAQNKDTIISILEREDIKLIRYHYHIVRSGDTLWSMSRNYGTSINIIEQHNPGISNRYLRIGETIIIPAYNDIVPPERAVSNLSYNGTHVVQKGETFWSLSRLYGVDPQDLAEANGMRLDQILHEGRTLRVPIIQ